MKTDKKEQKSDTPNPLCERVLETQDTPRQYTGKNGEHSDALIHLFYAFFYYQIG